MITTKLACEIIPGYDLLTETDRAVFEKTWTGEVLAQAIKKIEAYDTNTKYFFIWLFSETRKEYVERIRVAFNASLATNDEGKAIHQELLNTIQTQTETNATEEARLTALYLPHLNSACKNQIPVMKFDKFNLKQAEDLAKKIRTKELLSVDAWLPLYEQALLKYIENNLGLINDKDPLNDIITYDEIKDSLSYMLANGTPDFLKKIADAHGFIQATGFATQNETSYLVLIDIYNYCRHHEQIAEVKETIYSIMQPFLPLWTEYRNISKYERNLALKLLRTLIPFLILSAVVVLVAALLSQIVIPEIAFAIILIPTVYIGLIIATGYVAVKDGIYHTLRQSYYGGRFEIPEYQVNKRIAEGFNSREKANTVRDFYVDQIKLCFNKEAYYQQKTSGTLLDSEIQDRKDNTLRLGKLQLEWYDIHSNTKLGCDKISQIATNRLRLDIKQECAHIKKELPSQLKNEITELVSETKTEIKARIENKQYQPQLFKQPSCFKHRAEADRLNALMEEIRVVPN